MQTVLLAGIGIIAINKIFTRNEVTYISPNTHLSRNQSFGVDLRMFKNAGQFLTGSGHPDQHRYKFNVPKNLISVQSKCAIKNDGNLWLLGTNHFNTDGIVRRTQFKGSASQVSWPTLLMGSGWYQNAVEAYKPYLSRILPHQGVY
jgi:hypothetical protein